MVAEQRQGDGIDPRLERRGRQRSRERGKADYAADRLASQIGRCANANLGDGILCDFYVQRVWYGKGNHFTIELRANDPTLSFDLDVVQSEAARRLPLLRTELAREIHRKKVPTLAILVLPPTRFDKKRNEDSY